MKTDALAADGREIALFHAGNVLAQHAQHSRGRPQDASENRQQGCLAATRWTNEQHQLAAPHLERHLVERAHRRLALRIGLRQSVRLNDRVHRNTALQRRLS